MATLAAMKRQIAKLEAEVARKTREEMSGAIAKIREIMTTFGLTVEHLTSSVRSDVKKVPTKKSAAKKVKGKRAEAGTPKYRDPKSGATWTGFGRAPAWIASAKSRDSFLIEGAASGPAATVASAKVAATKKVAKTATVKKAKASKRSTSTPAKTAAEAPAVASKKAPAKAKKVASKKAASKKGPAKKVPTKTIAGKKAAAKALPSTAGAAPAADAT